MCGRVDGSRAQWRTDCPTESPSTCGWCLAPPEMVRWVRSVIPDVYIGPLVLPHFTPHHNIGLNRYVESREHLEHLKKVHGVEEVVVKKRKPGSMHPSAPTDAMSPQPAAEPRPIVDPQRRPGQTEEQYHAERAHIMRELEAEDEAFEDYTIIEPEETDRAGA